MTKNFKSGSLPQRSGKSIIWALIQGFDVQSQLPIIINVFEVQAILLTFQLHIKKWVNLIVIVCIDSTITFSKF